MFHWKVSGSFCFDAKVLTLFCVLYLYEIVLSLKPQGLLNFKKNTCVYFSHFSVRTLLQVSCDGSLKLYFV